MNLSHVLPAASLTAALLTLSACRLITGVDAPTEPDQSEVADMVAALDLEVELPPDVPDEGEDAADVSPDEEELGRDQAEMDPECEAEEVRCDGVDDDCDGTIDEGCDEDGDGVCAEGMVFVEPGGLVTCPLGGGDCDDTRADVYPGAPEFCGSGDLNCDGSAITLQVDARRLIQPVLEPGERGLIAQTRLLLIPSTAGQPDPTLMLLWTEQRATLELYVQRFSPLGNPLSQPDRLSQEGRSVLSFDAAVDEGSARVGVIMRQVDEATRGYALRFFTLGSQGQMSSPDVVLGEDQSLISLLFLNNLRRPRIFARDGVFGMFYELTRDAIPDVYFDRFDLEDGSRLAQPERVLANVNLNTVEIGWRAQPAKRGGEYIAMHLDANVQRYRMVSLDGVTGRKLVNTQSDRDFTLPGKRLAMSRSFDDFYIFMTEPNTDSMLTGVQRLRAHLVTHNNNFSQMSATIADDYGTNSPPLLSFYRTADPDVFTLFYHNIDPNNGSPRLGIRRLTYRFSTLTAASEAVQLDMTDLPLTPGELVHQPDVNQPLTFTLSRLVDDVAEHAALRSFTPSGATSFTRAVLPEVVVSEAYPYQVAPVYVDYDAAYISDEGDYSWLSVRGPSAAHEVVRHVLPADATPQLPRSLGVVKANAATQVAYRNGESWALTQELQTVGPGEPATASCRTLFELWRWDDDAQQWDAISQFTVDGIDSDTPQNTTVRCYSSSVNMRQVRVLGLSFLFPVTTTIPSRPSRSQSVVYRVGRTESEGASIVEGLSASARFTVVSATQVLFSEVRLDEDRKPASIMYGALNVRGELTIFSEVSLPEGTLSVEREQLATPEGAVVHWIVREAERAEAHATFVNAATRSIMTVPLGTLPLDPETLHEESSLRTFFNRFDGEKLIAQTVYESTRDGERAWRRFTRHVWPDGRVEPAEAPLESPTQRSSAYVMSAPGLPSGVTLLAAQDDRLHSLILTDDTLRERQRLDVPFAVAARFSSGAFDETRTTFLRTFPPYSIGLDQWRWLFWDSESTTSNPPLIAVDLICK